MPDHSAASLAYNHLLSTKSIRLDPIVSAKTKYQFFELARMEDPDLEEWASILSPDLSVLDSFHSRPQLPRYSYKPLSNANSIRLLAFTSSATTSRSIIQARIFEADLDSAIKYEALSYAWGDPSDKVPISLDSCTLQVTTNLYWFLWRLHQQLEQNREEYYYWANQIYIDQENNERSQQVALMGRIYSSSQRTLVWLGNVEGGASPAIAILQQLDQLGTDGGMQLGRLLKDAVTILRKVSDLTDGKYSLPRYYGTHPKLFI